MMYMDLISERAYQKSQGYEMQRLYRSASLGVWAKVRVTATVGNSSQAKHVIVERFDGAAWQEIGRLHSAELPDPPRYVCWTWTRESHPGALEHQDDCLAWLDEACTAGRALAVEVLS